MKMGEGRQEVRRKKGGVGDAGDKKEEAERVPLTLALTPVTPGGSSEREDFNFLKFLCTFILVLNM